MAKQDIPLYSIQLGKSIVFHCMLLYNAAVFFVINPYFGLINWKKRIQFEKSINKSNSTAGPFSVFIRTRICTIPVLQSWVYYNLLNFILYKNTRIQLNWILQKSTKWEIVMRVIWCIWMAPEFLVERLLTMQCVQRGAIRLILLYLSSLVKSGAQKDELLRRVEWRRGDQRTNGDIVLFCLLFSVWSVEHK